MHFIEPILMPRGTHYGNNYWEVYSSKIKRKVCLFSNLEYENFLTLEMNPLIKHFCEQPLKVDVIIDGEESRTVFDFWVKYQDGFEEMQEVKYSSELTGNDKSSLRTQSQIERQKFWCEQNHINYCIRTEETINKGKFFIRNYNIMAAKVRRYVPSNIDFLQDKIEEILVLEKKITIGELIQREELPENYELSFLSYLYYIGRIYMNIENKPLDFSTEVTQWLKNS